MTAARIRRVYGEIQKEMWVEVTSAGVPIRIFKNTKEMSQTSDTTVVDLMPRSVAISSIRNQIYERQRGTCNNCPKILTPDQAHMHEKVHRGQGGEISLDNSEILCYDCHLNGKHGNRKPRFGGKNESKSQ